MNAALPHGGAEDVELTTVMPTSDDARAIGEIIRESRALSALQVAQILQYQRDHDTKFGEAAIALGYATSEDVLRALALQFNYAYGNAEQQRASPELVVLNQPFGPQAESFRAIRAQIMMRTHVDVRGVPLKRALAVVSPNTGDGKTYFCANLSVSLAQMGGRTLVVDADLRGARLHEVFDVDTRSGLSTLLAGRRADGVIKPVKSVPNLFVMPVGPHPPNPLELVQQPHFGLLLQELLTRFDHVVVDTPAAQYGADCAVVAGRCGAALVVARKDATKVDDLQAFAQTLAAANAKLAGVVMNEFSPPRPR